MRAIFARAGKRLRGVLGVVVVGWVLASVGYANPEPGDWEVVARWLAEQKIPYGGAWAVPAAQGSSVGAVGGSESVGVPRAMDCSNTTRWLYGHFFGGDLPRTASGQYEFFQERGKLKRASANRGRLAKVLQPGDFLFWEHTYKPKRKPPVTHVMVYLGKDAAGKMWMVGAQNSRGVAIYEFRPEAKMGGYRWFLWFQKSGKFVGFGRP